MQVTHPRTIKTDEAVVGTSNTPIIVEQGATVTVMGTLNASAVVLGVMNITGTLNGSLHISAGAAATVEHRVNGSVHVDRGGLVVVEPRGRIAGSTHNVGRIVLRGQLGGSQSGIPVELEDGGRVVAPTRFGSRGEHIYEWHN